MISSTPRSRFLKGFAAALAVPLAALALSHAGLEVLSRWAESKPGYYLWRNDDYLLLLSPGRFRHSGKDRVMIFGASESAEGFIDNAIERRLPGISAGNMAFDGATFKDFLIQLEYMESIYGAGAIPSDIVVGISPRFVANIKTPRGQFFKQAIDVYSAGEPVVTGSTARIARKNRWERAASWIRFRVRQTERYRYALLAAGLEVAYRLRPEWARKHDLRARLAKAKYWARKSHGDDAFRAGLAAMDHWRQTHTWRASEHRDAVESEMSALSAFARRNHTRLYFVNMPLMPVHKDMFASGVYEDYLKTMDAMRGDAPLLNLDDFLTRAEFSDGVHATGAGARRISAATADFIRLHELSTRAVKTGK